VSPALPIKRLRAKQVFARAFRPLCQSLRMIPHRHPSPTSISTPPFGIAYLLAVAEARVSALCALVGKQASNLYRVVGATGRPPWAFDTI